MNREAHTSTTNWHVMFFAEYKAWYRYDFVKK